MSEVLLETRITEVGNLESARRVLRYEFKRMGDAMLVKQAGKVGLNLLPDKFMEFLTDDVQTIVKFVSRKNESIQKLLQRVFDNDFTLHLYMLSNSGTNIFSLEQLSTIQETALAMNREFPYFSDSANALSQAVGSYAEKFGIELPGVESE